jgi:hypothetical protein
MEAVDGSGVERLALSGRLGHRVDRHAAVDPTGVVPLEEMVGQRGEDEIVGLEHVPLQAVGANRMQIGLEYPADEELRQRLAVLVLEEAAYRINERRPEYLRHTQTVEYEAAPLGSFERLGQKLSVIVDDHPFIPQGLGERVMLFLGLGRPHHVIEEQRLDVFRGEARQLEARPVDDRLSEPADLGSYAKRHIHSFHWGVTV